MDCISYHREVAFNVINYGRTIAIIFHCVCIRVFHRCYLLKLKISKVKENHTCQIVKQMNEHFFAESNLSLCIKSIHEF